MTILLVLVLLGLLGNRLHGLRIRIMSHIADLLVTLAASLAFPGRCRRRPVHRFGRTDRSISGLEPPPLVGPPS